MRCIIIYALREIPAEASNAQRSPFSAEYQSYDINAQEPVTVAAFFYEKVWKKERIYGII